MSATVNAPTLTWRLTDTRLVEYSRTLTILSLRLLAQLLINLAEVLERRPQENTAGLKEHVAEKDLNELYDLISAEVMETTALTTAAASCRSRCDSLCSVDSGNGDDEQLLQLEVDPETGLDVYSLSEVSEHCFPEDAWTVIYDRVYDITDYMDRHPGGNDVMLEYIGYDATIAFRGVGHSRAAFKSLERYCIGILPVNERLNYEPEF